MINYGYAASIARALVGHRSGDGYVVRCPVPGHGRGHGDRRPSLFIKDGDSRLLVTCFAGCPAADVLRALARRGMLVAQSVPRPQRESRRCSDHQRPDRKALQIWRTSLPVAGSLAERYLAGQRGLTPPYPPTVRFAAAAFHPRQRLTMRAVVAAVQGLAGNITAVQLTFLTSDGAKASLAEPRWTYGALGEGAVRLGPSADALGIAEGIEDALAASQLS